MATFTRFEEMEAWKTARVLTRGIYEVLGAGVFARDFGLRDQMRRAAVSVMSNIAEGCDSRTEPQFVEYLGRARASGGELRCQLYIAKDLGYLDEAAFAQLFDTVDKCCRQLSRLILHLEQKNNARRTNWIGEPNGPDYQTDIFVTSQHDPTSYDPTSHE
jgi:four helix bundle protein